MKYVIVVLSAIITVAGVGCVALSQFLTPAEIDQNAVQYVAQTKLADANEFAGWPNLIKAEKLKVAVDSSHQLIQLDLAQRMDKDNMIYAHLAEVTTNNYQAAVEREDMLFSETGLFSMGLGLAGFGTLTGYLGLMRKRASDVTLTDAQKMVADAVGKTTDQLSEKETQFVQVIMGVQKFIASFDNPKDPVVVKLKEALASQQDTSTEIAVATTLKATPTIA
jgi:hypothetical protein